MTARLRVVTWNLQWRERDDWHARQPGIRSTLEAVRPDVAGLQEVWATAGTNHAAQLADQLGMHAAFAAPSLPPPRPPERPDQAGVEVGVAVLSRWPVLHVERHRLPSRHRPEIVALLPVLLTADLNAPPATREVRVLTDATVDAWPAAAVPPAAGTR